MSEKIADKKNGISLEDCALIQETTNYMIFNPELHGKTLFEVVTLDIPLWALVPDAPLHIIKGFNKYRKLNSEIERKTYKDFNQTIANDKKITKLWGKYKRHMVANPAAYGKMLKEIAELKTPFFIEKQDTPPILAINAEKYENLLYDIFQKNINDYENCYLLNYNHKKFPKSY